MESFLKSVMRAPAMLDVSSNDESTTCQLLGRETPDAVGMSSQIHIILSSISSVFSFKSAHYSPECP